MVRGALSDDNMIQLKVVIWTLNSQKYPDQILESGVMPLLDSPDGQDMVLRDEIVRPHFTRIIEEYKNQHNIANLPGLSFFLFRERSGRVLDSRPRGRRFQPHMRHCVVVLEQDTFILA